jgi:hypothetical protein
MLDGGWFKFGSCVSAFWLREKLCRAKYEKWLQNTAAPKKGTKKGCVGTIQKTIFLFIYDLGEIMSFVIV